MREIENGDEGVCPPPCRQTPLEIRYATGAQISTPIDPSFAACQMSLATEIN